MIQVELASWASSLVPCSCWALSSLRLAIDLVCAAQAIRPLRSKLLRCLRRSERIARVDRGKTGRRGRIGNRHLPSACCCARTIELSMNCSDLGDRAASASNRRIHTPRFRPAVEPIAWCRDRSARADPARASRCANPEMPLSTRRSSTRGNATRLVWQKRRDDRPFCIRQVEASHDPRPPIFGLESLLAPVGKP